jgi:hypothetical protein
MLFLWPLRERMTSILTVAMDWDGLSSFCIGGEGTTTEFLACEDPIYTTANLTDITAYL